MSFMILVQFGFILFILFAASRALLRFRGGSLHLGALLFWIFVWTAASIVVFSPEKTAEVAKMLGVGRGADIVIYSAIILLFYLVFRLHVYLEEMRTLTNQLIRELSLQTASTNMGKKKKGV